MEELEYRIQKEHIEITGISPLVRECVIPETIDGLPVTGIAKKAFLSRKNLVKVVLPQTIEEIGDWAFAYCSSLRTVELANTQVHFGRFVFLDCDSLTSLRADSMECETGALLAAAVTGLQAGYLLDLSEAGKESWLQKWDAALEAYIALRDADGYSRQVLCGEEDYGSTDYEAYVRDKRRKKVRLIYLRLLNPIGLTQESREALEQYLRAHTKLSDSEEAWEVLCREHGHEESYFKLFAAIGCLTRQNLPACIKDAGEDHPELKAYFLSYFEEGKQTEGFFENLLF